MTPLSKNIALAAAATVFTSVAVIATPSKSHGQPAGSNKNAGTGNAASMSHPSSEAKATPESFVDALNFAFGKQTTQRATHAKGVVLIGKFTPSEQARNVSQAPHFQQGVPITVRFSANTGMPKLADTAPLASPRGMSIKFHLPDGTETDLVTHSYNGFPTKNADEQRLFFIAVGQSGPGVSSPTPIEQFMATHPAAKAFLTSQDPPPVSYATLSYFGVNSFKFTNAKGKAKFGRYQLIPEAGRHFLSADEARRAAPEYLTDELRARIARGDARFRLVLQLAAAADKIDDPSIAWADSNEQVSLGVLSISAFVPDSVATERGLLFLPGVLPVGIEAADPMIQFRSKTYPVSYERRQNP